MIYIITLDDHWGRPVLTKAKKRIIITKGKIIPGLIGLFECCLLVVDGLIVDREEDEDDIGFELSPVSIGSSDAAPGWSIRPFDPDILKKNL